MDSRIATAFSVRERVLLEKIHVAQRRLCLNDYNYDGFFPFSETIERTDLVTKMYFENSLVSRFSFNAKFADIARRLDRSSGHYFGVFWLHQGSLSPVHSGVRLLNRSFTSSNKKNELPELRSSFERFCDLSRQHSRYRDHQFHCPTR